MDAKTYERVSRVKVLKFISKAKSICEFHGWDLDWFIKALEQPLKVK